MPQRKGNPWLAHAYVYSVIFAGGIAIFTAAPGLSEWPNFAMFAVMVGIASCFPIVVKLERFFVVTPGLVQAAMLVWGPPAGILTAALGGLAASFNRSGGKPFSISPYKMSFNIAGFALAACLHASILQWGTGQWQQGRVWGFLVVYLLAPLAGNVVNTVLVALAIHLHAQVPLSAILRTSAWVVPYWVVLWAIGGVMALNYRGTGLIGIVVFLLPLFLVRYAFQLYVAKSKEAEAYVNDLRESNGKLGDTVQLLSVLHRGSVMLTGNLDPQLVPLRVRDLAVEALSFPHGGLYDHDRHGLRCLGAWHDGGHVSTCESEHMQQVARLATGQTSVQNVTVEGNAWCLLPLVMYGSPIGMLFLGGSQESMTKNAGVLETFAAQVAAALATSRLHAETRRMALTDGLTGLHNQRSMREQLSGLMEQAQAQGTPLSLATLDLDKFKQINDRFGHPVGDRAIREVAATLLARLGPNDVAARNGGDEFALILPGKQAEEARTFLQELAEAVARVELLHGKQRINLTLSVGIATFPDHANTTPALISRSDQAVYISKHTGRNRITVWGDMPGVEDQLGQHWSWALDDKRDVNGQTADPVKVMTAMVDARDGLTYGHSVRVQKYCAAVAGLLGLSDAQVASVSLGGLLHDVGKIGIPDHILNKPGPLTIQETEIVKQHPEIGAELMRRIGMPEEMVAMVLHHHEFFNGHGYPSGLAGKDIPLGARILAVCDAFEAITSRRPYKQPKPIPWAVAELRRCAGTQFDPEIVEVFVKGVLGQGAVEHVAAGQAADTGAKISGGGSA